MNDPQHPTSLMLDENGQPTRRQALQRAAVSLAGLAAITRSTHGATPTNANATDLAGPSSRPPGKLRVATCQFPVSADVLANAKHMQHFMQLAAERGAHHADEAGSAGRLPGEDRDGRRAGHAVRSDVPDPLECGGPHWPDFELVDSEKVPVNSRTTPCSPTHSQNAR